MSELNYTAFLGLKGTATPVLADVLEKINHAEELGYAGFCSYIREQREALLIETDWCANSDVIMSDDMTTYRQALRDITDQAGFPDNITWPTKPE